MPQTASQGIGGRRRGEGESSWLPVSEVDIGEISVRLSRRRAEIEQTVLARVQEISPLREAADPSYAVGLRSAVSVAIGFAIEAIGEPRASRRVPEALLDQARHAARSQVPMDTVLRRYVAGHALVSDFVIQEAQHARMQPDRLQCLSRNMAVLFDQVAATAATAYREESEARGSSRRRRRAEIVRRLLVGELLEAPELGYDFDAWHVAIVAQGDDGEAMVRELAADTDCRCLVVPGADDVAWGWLGSRRWMDPRAHLDVARPREKMALALGEPAQGLAGWRLTHRQAAFAAPIASKKRPSAVRYADVVLLATVMHDDLLRESLERMFLAPMAAERARGVDLCTTLRAYFDAERNVSCTASALGLSRQTVGSHLRMVEEAIGRTVASCGPELELAIRLEEITVSGRAGPDLSD